MDKLMHTGKFLSVPALDKEKDNYWERGNEPLPEMRLLSVI